MWVSSPSLSMIQGPVIWMGAHLSNQGVGDLKSLLGPPSSILVTAKKKRLCLYSTRHHASWAKPKMLWAQVVPGCKHLITEGFESYT